MMEAGAALFGHQRVGLPDGLVMLGAGETTVGLSDALVPEKGGTGFHHLAIGMPVQSMTSPSGASAVASRTKARSRVARSK